MTTIETTTITCTCGKSHDLPANSSSVGSRLVNGWNVVMTMDGKIIDLCPSCYTEATELAQRLAVIAGNRYVSISHLTRELTKEDLERKQEKALPELELVTVTEELPEGYEYIVFSQSYRSSLSEIPQLAGQLKGKFKGEVLVDTLSSQGNNSSRLLTVMFDGEKFDMKSFERATSASRPLRQFLTDYWKQRPELLKQTVVNSAQFKMIMKGLPLGDATKPENE